MSYNSYDRRGIENNSKKDGMDPILKNLIWILIIAIILIIVF